MLALADLYDLVGDYDSAIRLFAKRVDASADLRAWRGLAASHRKQGEYERALAVVDEGFATVKVGDGDLTALWLERGWSLSVAGRFQPAIVALQAGLDAAGGKRDAVAAQLLLQLARAETVEGHFDAAPRARTCRPGDLCGAAGHPGDGDRVPDRRRRLHTGWATRRGRRDASAGTRSCGARR